MGETDSARADEAPSARDLSGGDTGREERSAAIDNVLMRLVGRVLEKVKEARDAHASGEPQDPAVPLDRMIDVLDDLIEARQELDRLYGTEGTD